MTRCRGIRLVAAVSALVAACPVSGAFAASGSSADGKVVWTTDVNGISTVTGAYSVSAPAMTFRSGTVSGSDAMQDTITSVSPAGGSGGYLAAGNQYNGGLYRPDGTHVQEDVYFSDTSSPTTGGSLTIFFSSARTFFGALVNSLSGVSSVTLYSHNASIFSLPLNSTGTYETSSSPPRYSDYLNVSASNGDTFDEISFTYGGVSSGQYNQVSLGEMSASAYAASSSNAGSGQVPEPDLGFCLIGCVFFAGFFRLGVPARRSWSADS